VCMCVCVFACIQRVCVCVCVSTPAERAQACLLGWFAEKVHGHGLRGGTRGKRAAGAFAAPPPVWPASRRTIPCAAMVLT
jgi:hypothetical protein